MRYSRVLTALFLGVAVGLGSCRRCGTVSEPNMQFSIRSGKPFLLDTLYGAGAVGQLPNPVRPQTGTSFYAYSLPLNLAADSTRYVLRLDGKLETLTLFYKRKFDYRNQECGYVVELLKPENGTTARLSRGRVTVAEYVPADYSAIGWGSSRERTNIRLTIEL